MKSHSLLVAGPWCDRYTVDPQKLVSRPPFVTEPPNFIWVHGAQIKHFSASLMIDLET